ncbi:MAG TPA: helix-turn-helix transcriptional regulator [Candidatus Enterenecus merdae]|nr:helix-turn-helix transcriptional regulator [Candidatus Enterenecus merdae]
MKVERNRLGLKQSDVAAYLGIEVRSYQYYEAGRRRPDYEGLVALADYFDVTTDYLLGRADTQK